MTWASNSPSEYVAMGWLERPPVMEESPLVAKALLLSASSLHTFIQLGELLYLNDTCSLSVLSTSTYLQFAASKHK